MFCTLLSLGNDVLINTKQTNKLRLLTAIQSSEGNEQRVATPVLYAREHTLHFV